MALTKVTRSGITDDSINADKIEDGTIVDADITPGTITNAKLAGSITNAKLANSSITVNCASVSLGGSFSAGSIDWQSKVTSDGSTVTTMVAGRGYFIDNTSAAGLVKLPASASAGDTIAIKDYAGNFGTNNLTIQRNSHNIQGVANDGLIATNRASLVLVYVDATKGWLYTNESNVADLQTSLFVEATGGTVTESGDFKIHTFTGDGCFVVSQLGNPAGGPNTLDYLVIAGGGAGGGSLFGNGMSGGGAGGYRESKSGNTGSWTASPLVNPTGLTATVTTYPVTVGAGGSQGAAYGPIGSSPPGTSGSNSVFSTITSAGGGRGGDYLYPGIDGGSGSGGGDVNNKPGGAGNTPPVSPPQGNNGGDGANPPSPGVGMGGSGGGAGGAGSPGSPVSGTVAGGPGTPTGFTGSGVTYAAGGRSKALPNSPTSEVGPAGSANTGDAGGGAAVGGAGGKGLVVIRYKFQ